MTATRNAFLALANDYRKIVSDADLRARRKAGYSGEIGKVLAAMTAELFSSVVADLEALAAASEEKGDAE